MRSFLFFALLFSYSTACFAQAAFFDPTFGTGGKTIIPFTGSAGGQFEAIVLQPDGKIAVAGVFNYCPVIGRFKINGTPDTAFGVNGFLTLPISGAGIRDITIQPDGKIVGGGYKNDMCFAMRVSASGIADVDFGTGGSIAVPNGLMSDISKAIALQIDGKILITGSASPANVGLVRLHTDGRPDSSFGINGRLTGPSGDPEDIEILSDGKVILGGTASAAKDYAMMAIRYLPDGTLDPSFNGTGIAYKIAGEERSNFGRALCIQPDGKVLVAGSGGFGGQGSDFTVVRFNTDGSSDLSFGTDGIAHIDFDGGDEEAMAVYLTPDGKIVLAGTTGLSAQRKIAIARLNADGTQDHSFGNDSRIILTAGGVADFGRDAIGQPDGKVLVAGLSYRDFSSTGLNDAVVLRAFSSAAGIPADLLPATELFLYPNPASKQLFITQKTAAHITAVSVTDIAGRQLPAQVKNNTIDIRHLPDGLYVFNIIFDNKNVAAQRIVIQNNM